MTSVHDIIDGSSRYDLLKFLVGDYFHTFIQTLQKPKQVLWEKEMKVSVCSLTSILSTKNDMALNPDKINPIFVG